MSMGLQGDTGLGAIKIFIGKPNSNMSPEFWAERAVDRILQIATTAHPDVRAQAQAFREQIMRVITGAVASAVSERKARDAMLAGRKDSEIAQIIREDK